VGAVLTGAMVGVEASRKRREAAVAKEQRDSASGGEK